MNFIDYNEGTSDLEKAYKFDEAIKNIEEYLSDLEKLGKPPTITYKNVGGKKMKNLIWRGKGFEMDFYHPYRWMGAIYLKISTDSAIKYWRSLEKSPYCEDDSFFKEMLIEGLSEAFYKKDKGYVYKPQTKESQEIFMEYAKKKGWR